MALFDGRTRSGKQAKGIIAILMLPFALLQLAIALVMLPISLLRVLGGGRRKVAPAVATGRIESVAALQPVSQIEPRMPGQRPFTPPVVPLEPGPPLSLNEPAALVSICLAFLVMLTLGGWGFANRATLAGAQVETRISWPTMRNSWEAGQSGGAMLDALYRAPVQTRAQREGAIQDGIAMLPMILFCGAMLVASPFIVKYEIRHSAWRRLQQAATVEARAKWNFDYRQSLIARFGQEGAAAFVQRQIWYGAPRDAVLELYGNPVSVDDKMLKTKVVEVFKYQPLAKNRYGLKVTLENGAVTEWETKQK